MVKMFWSEISIVCLRKYKSLLIPLHAWVFTGAPMQRKQEHMAPPFLSQYPPPIEMACTI